MPHILVVGSLAYDDVQTPYDRRRDVLGGAASYFSLAARLYAPVRLMGVVGDDFRESDLERLQKKGVDIGGVERAKGRSFRWLGRYDHDLVTAETINTDLGVFGDWEPQVPASFTDSEFVFLANILPEIQLRMLEQVRAPVVVALDTMNYWIERKRDALTTVMARVDIVTINEAEARQFRGTHNVIRAAREILALGPRAVVIKRAEYGALALMRGTGGGAPRLFWTPAYPLEEVRDPTGAGDAFAGGLLGHLARAGTLDDRTLCRAVLHGTVCASFAVEQFSVDGIEQADEAGIEARVRELQALVSA
ncbi:MAG TPA: PfkB family carbohydrate kinase [Candidatus Limnocylindria bacterium]|nr:PfkB family carbohydrate kinase [Candidatus Limnocylindria bacterium]